MTISADSHVTTLRSWQSCDNISWQSCDIISDSHVTSADSHVTTSADSHVTTSADSQVSDPSPLTSGVSWMCLAHCRIRRMASMLMSGKALLQANSDKHIMPSWKESMASAKYVSKIWSTKEHNKKSKTICILTYVLATALMWAILHFTENFDTLTQLQNCTQWQPAPHIKNYKFLSSEHTCSRIDLNISRYHGKHGIALLNTYYLPTVWITVETPWGKVTTAIRWADCEQIRSRINNN